MAITSRNQRLIAYKKLVGKSHSSSKIGDVSEPFASSVQSNSAEIFADDPTTSDQNPKFSKKVTFELEPIDGTSYAPIIVGVEAEGEETTNNTHGFRLKFPAGDTLANQFITDNIKYQLVSTKYGTLYKPILKDSSGAIMEQDGRYEWALDFYSGVVFMQDLPSDSNKLPSTIEAYFYTGKYVSDFARSNDQGEIEGVFDTLDVGIDQNNIPEFSNLPINLPIVRIGASAGIQGDLEVNGKLYTNELIVEKTTKIITDNINQGNNIFGDPDTSIDNCDTHTFYGDVTINGNLSITGDGPNKKKVFEITRDKLNSSSPNELNFDSPPEELADIKKGNLFLIKNLDNDAGTGDDIEIRLPDIEDISVWDGTEYIFKHICDEREQHNVHIQPAEGVGQTIDGQTQVTLHAQYESITIIAHNGQWHIV